MVCRRYGQAREEGRLPEFDMLVYTGPIDSYFAAQGMPKLEYRSLRFEEEWVPEPEEGFFQEAMVVNHPSPEARRQCRGPHCGTRS